MQLYTKNTVSQCYLFQNHKDDLNQCMQYVSEFKDTKTPLNSINISVIPWHLTVFIKTTTNLSKEEKQKNVSFYMNSFII